MDYAKATGSKVSIVAWLILSLMTQGIYLVSDWFLSYWMDLDPATRRERKNLIIYAALVVAFVVTCFMRAIYFMRGAAKASFNLNNMAFNAVVHSPIRFFDTNPLGRILNRFSKV